MAKYDIVLGIREDSQLAPEDGVYKAAINHMTFSTIDMREWKPSSADEAAAFQSKCMRFTVFGVPKDEVQKIGETFNPRNIASIKMFDTRSTGNHCG